MVMFYKVPFGTSGDRSAVPLTAASALLSYTYGYGADYGLPLQTDINALPVGRQTFNEIVYDITANIQQYQIHGTPEFITTADNGGSPYSYTKDAKVRYDAGSGYHIYQSLIDSNTDLPTVAASWILISGNVGFLNNTQTWSGVNTFSNNIVGNLTGNSTTVTTNANLSGDVTSIGNATTLTNAPVIAKILTGFSASAGTVSAADSILTAFGKVVGNIALKASLISPVLTGTPTAPTATVGTNTTQLATTAFVLANAVGTAQATSTQVTNETAVAAYISPDLVKYSNRTAKLWINFNTVTTTTITSSFNVTSLTDNGGGDTTINFTTNLSSANYSVGWMCQRVGNSPVMNINANPSVSSLRVLVYQVSSGAGLDCPVNCVTIDGAL